MKKFICTICGYVYEGDKAPDECPVCRQPGEKFKEEVLEDSMDSQKPGSMATASGTRAVAAFIQGHWARSFRYHPFVPYCGILYIIFMTKGTLALFSKEKFPYMKFRNGYIYFGIVILLVQFVIKDIMLLVYGVDVLGIV